MKNKLFRGLGSSNLNNESSSCMTPSSILDLARSKNIKISKGVEDLLVSLYDNKFSGLQ